MAKKVLVTGAAGLIGREICKKLSKDFLVLGIDNNFRYPDFEPACNYVRSDISKYLASNSNDFDYVFHMAAINGTSHFYEIPNQLVENNISSDLDIFKFVSTSPRCKLIYASSSEIVAGTSSFPTAELTDIYIENIHNPRWSYRLSKILAENYLMNSQLDFLIVRFFNVFGKDSAPGHFVNDIIQKINLHNYDLVGPDETRSFCRVEDAVDALLKIYDKVSSEVINIGSDEEITVLAAANIIASHLNKKIVWRAVTSKEGSATRRQPDLHKLRIYYPNFAPQKFKDSVGDL